MKLEIAALLYHDVTDPPVESGFQRPAARQYKHTTAVFRDHLDRIESSQLVPELAPDVDYNKPGRHLLLTFDDGGASATRISDMLSARGWKGHFLITTGLIGTRGFLDVQGIRYIRSCGHIIGSHSHSHPDIFKAQPIEKMIQQWRVSCDCIAQILSEPCSIASVPGGDISPTVLESASLASIEYLFTSEPRLKPHKAGRTWVIGRACPKSSTSASHVRRLARFDPWSWKQELVVRRLKVLARTMAAPLYESYVRHTTNAI